MEIFEFNVKFITPLLIGGANSRREADNLGLTGKALRGCWRFWCRSLIGGIIEDVDKEELNNLENEIFGSADLEIGSKFRMNVMKNDNYKQEKFELGFWRNGRQPEKSGFPLGSSYLIRITPRKNMSKSEINVLFATIWVWGNLGAVGNRARRGFGSPVIYHNENNNPFDIEVDNQKKVILPLREKAFENVPDLEDHLQMGLSNVWMIYKQWIKKNKIDNLKVIEDDLGMTSAPEKVPYFILRSFEQISVGNFGIENIGKAIERVHGSSRCNELGWAIGSRRMSSPVFFRFHKINGINNEEFLPIFTWCKQRGINGNCARNYLKELAVNNEKLFSRNLLWGQL